MASVQWVNLDVDEFEYGSWKLVLDLVIEGRCKFLVIEEENRFDRKGV